MKNGKQNIENFIYFFFKSENLNPQQVEDLRQAFSVFDRDQSGSITIEELENVMLSIGISPSSRNLKDLVC